MTDNKKTGKLNKNTRSLLVVLVVMLVCVAASGIVWVERMTPYFSAEIDASAIVLVPEDVEEPGNCVEVPHEVISMSSSASTASGQTSTSRKPFVEKYGELPVPGFEISDENTVWGTATEVEIFKVSYENGEGVVTVNSNNGDKLLAPGTENEYTFWLKNTGNVPVHYTIETEAYYSNNNYAIPVEVRMKDYYGHYLLGDQEKWDEVMRLNEISDSAALDRNSYASYTLEWQWPFETDDEYDTLLGNMAVDEDLTLTVVIRTIATAEFVKTGDDSHMALWFALAAASMMVVLVIVYKRKKADEA